jgi:hypothetical protein
MNLDSTLDVEIVMRKSAFNAAQPLAWQSYSDAAKQVIATSAPELGWSPEAKQMIAGWVQQLG